MIQVMIETAGPISDPQEEGLSSEVAVSNPHGSEGLVKGQEGMIPEGALEIETDLIKPTAKKYDPPKYRLRGKRVPLEFPSARPVLCPLRTGGESGEHHSGLQLGRRTSGWNESI